MTPEFLIGNITLFVLAIFLGFELITKVPATLHTPLMSGANAISGISIIGHSSALMWLMNQEIQQFQEFLHLLQ